MKSITQYDDYRSFLKDRYAHLKSENKYFSYLHCAQKLGTSKNYIKLIIDKKRHLGIEKVSSLGHLFKLNKFERQYLFFLFLKSTVNDEDLSIYIRGVLGSLKAKALTDSLDPVAESPEEKESIFQNWLQMALHSMVRLHDFNPDPKWIQEQMNEQVPTELIMKHFQQLIESGSIVKDSSGRYLPGEFIFRKPEVENVAGFSAPILGLKKTQEAMKNPERFLPVSYYVMMVAMDQDTFDQVRTRMLDLRNFIIDSSQACKKPDQVLFTCNHIFGVTK